ncbi:related to UPF0357 protein YCL012C [Saccharomycodes ludwigii]|uniref:Related to UPF0357 protein YCL012C n=2 Tax=Saccharomycodes ludwigii TaxID=36035 RepID=A0A376B251_9ASCO|nr:related to UPF0357 protein YCL012C [Saccharomycodes ludwigii]
MKELYTKLKLRINNGSIRLNDAFVDDLENGLSSANFDIISHNSSDNRRGLDEVNKLEIKRLMEEKNISFDEARLLYMNNRMSENSISDNGIPIDPKVVTFKSALKN